MATWNATENEQFDDVEWVNPQTGWQTELLPVEHRPLGPGPVITTVQPPIPGPVIIGPTPYPLQFPLNPSQYPAYYQLPMQAYPVLTRDVQGHQGYEEMRFFPIPLPIPGPVFYPRPPFYPYLPYGYPRPPFYGPIRPPFVW